jgi:hypothetical protein
MAAEVPTSPSAARTAGSSGTIPRPAVMVAATTEAALAAAAAAVVATA